VMLMEDAIQGLARLGNVVALLPLNVVETTCAMVQRIRKHVLLTVLVMIMEDAIQGLARQREHQLLSVATHSKRTARLT